MLRRNMRSTKLVLVFFTVFILCGAVAQADPLFRMRLENLTTGKGVVLTDNGAGDNAAQPGVISFSGSLDGFTVNITTGLTAPAIGGVNNLAELDLNSVNVLGSGAGTLRISLEDGGYNLGNGQVYLQQLVGGTLTAPAGSSVSFRAWANAGDLVPDYGADSPVASSLAPLGSIPAGSPVVIANSGPGAFSNTGYQNFTIAGPYSLFSQATIVFTGSGMVSFDQNTQALPAQSSLLLLGMGLGGVILVSRKRKPAQSQVQ